MYYTLLSVEFQLCKLLGESCEEVNLQGNKQHEMVMGRSPMINFNVLEFITGLLIILFYDDRRFHARVDVAMIGIRTCFRKRECKGTIGGNDPAIKRPF